MDSNTPLISIIIPVYNAAKSLNQCVDALVYQDYKNIEVLIMEKASTDNSLEIAQRYEQEFPDIVRAISLPYTDNPARALNEGAKLARGEYLCFNDPDDYFQLNAMGKIAEKIGENKFDIAMMFANVVDQNGNIQRISKLVYPFTKENVLTKIDLMTYWRCVIRREYFLEQPEIYEDCKYADVTWLPNYIAKAVRLDAIPYPLYNYVANNGFTSAAGKANLSVLQALDGFDYLLDTAEERYINELVMFVATRFIPSSKNMTLKDVYIDWAVKHQDLFMNNKYMLSPEKKIYLDSYQALLDAEAEYVIPKRLYVNGFDPALTEEKLEHFRQHSFILADGEVVVLDESNCDLDELPCAREALENGRYDYVGHYFALKNIYENGGFYAGRRVVFTAYLNIQRRTEAFFSYFNESSFTDEIFGAAAEAVIIKRLLDTYSIPDFYEDTFLPLADRIKNVAVATLHRLNLNGRSVVTEGVKFTAPDVHVLHTNTEAQISYIDFAQDITEDTDLNDYVIAPWSVCDAVHNGAVTTANNTPTAELQKLKRDLAAAQKKLRQIEGSDSYKFSKRLSKMGNTAIGKPFKKMFKWFLKKYRKRKYGI